MKDTKLIYILQWKHLLYSPHKILNPSNFRKFNEPSNYSRLKNNSSQYKGRWLLSTCELYQIVANFSSIFQLKHVFITRAKFREKLASENSNFSHFSYLSDRENQTKFKLTNREIWLEISYTSYIRSLTLQIYV